MKLTKFVPCIRSCAIHALLSPRFETWQSAQVFVSVVLTVCGTCVAKDWPEKPSVETVCCCEYIHSRFWFCELTRMAERDAAGATRRPVTVPSRPSMNTSSLSTLKLYFVKLREVSP